MSVEGHAGFRNDPATVTDRQLERWLPEGLREDDRYVEGMRKYLANTGYAKDASESNAARVFGDATKLMEEAADKQPFALVVDSFDPHEPWSPTAELIDMYADPSYRGPNPGTARYTRAETYLEPEELRQMNAVYAASLTNADRWLGEFLDRFRELGLQENTVIVFLSDHGILLGDRGWTGKIAQELHPELIQVPCVIVHPEGKARGQHERVVCLHARRRADAAVAGGRRPGGRGRARTCRCSSTARSCRSGPSRTAATSTTSTCATTGGPTWPTTAAGRKLYDLTLDPAELNDVAGENRDVHEELHARLLEEIGGLPPYYEGEAVEPVKR